MLKAELKDFSILQLFMGKKYHDKNLYKSTKKHTFIFRIKRFIKGN